jgi:hypothetical protein
MKYAEYRKNVKSGDIIALSHYEWASWRDLQIQAVRLFTESEYSHVGLIWKVSGRLFVIEAVTPFIRIVPLSQYAKDGFYHVPMKKPMSSQELEYALSEVGVGGYSKLEAIKGFLKTLRIGDNHEWQCSEFVIACRNISGVFLGDTATPSAVVQAALSQGNTLNYVKD